MNDQTSIPSASLRPLKRGAVTPPAVVAGADGLVLLAPLDEGAGVAAPEPPVRPTMATAGNLTASARKMMASDGRASVLALATGTRASWSLRWSGMTLAEARLLLDWLDLECEQTLRPWPMRVDGAGDDVTLVRFLRRVVVKQVAAGVFETGDIEVEEVL